MPAEETAEAIWILIRRVFKSLVFIAFSFAFLGLISLLGYGAYEKWKVRPIKITRLEGIALGMSMDEVRYVKGRAEHLLYDDGSKYGLLVLGSDELEKQPFKDKTDKDFFWWSWGEHSKRIDVSFDKETKAVRAISCYDGDKVGNCAINSVKSGDTEEKVYEILGENVESFLEEGGASKRMIYKEFNMAVYLAQTRVYMLTVEQFNNVQRD